MEQVIDRDRRLAVVMLTVDQRDMTLRALNSLMCQLGEGTGVLVWDNGSSDDTGPMVAQYFPEVVVCRSEVNLGVASGRNAAARAAIERWKPDYLLFLDNDLILREGFVAALIDRLDEYPDVGQVQAKLLYLDEPSRINDGGGSRIIFWLGKTDPVGFKELDRGQFDLVTECVCCGGAMMVRREIFESLDGFDESFSPYGPEDIDFSLRLKECGHRAQYVPAAVALHAANHTWGKEGNSPAYAQSRVRHWLHFLNRHASWLQKSGFYLLGAPLIAVRMVVRELLRGNPSALVGSIRGLLDQGRVLK
ncbi:MAG: glycosyltransferase family 2 protein [Luminiphilus sp.]